MPHRDTPDKPDIKEMPSEEKWGRLHDFFTTAARPRRPARPA